ncbi:MAG: hypothetical protein A3F72_14495 [Bacteroidetes bacterium RIFCSPLOWO2_12_FULL_35_15]|nr:MAG: hypothetical protein A3F72_14495 [Bacteroidetes bacterium RIFCSPLOWO2_12_FULL_35_15]
MNRLEDIELLKELEVRLLENKQTFEKQQLLMLQLIETNKKLEESEKLKSQFLSNIRNEINNPLTSILVLSDNIKNMQQIDEHKIRLFAAMISEEAIKLDFQFKNIFVAAEIEAGEISMRLIKTDVKEIISTIEKLFTPFYSRKNIEIKIENNLPEGYLLKTDNQKLNLILSNLVANAIEYSSAESEIIIAVFQKDNKILFSIQDFGIGISPENHSIIFDRFVQLDNGSKKSHSGHGIGLSIVKSLLDLLGGTIEINSSEGNGSKFTILLPDNIEQKEQKEILEEDDEFLF